MSSNVSSLTELLPPESWTEDLFGTCSPPISMASPSVTSSLEAACGAPPLGSPGGQIASPCGPALAPAKAKVSPAKGLEPMIQGICGRTFIGSSVPEGRLSSWESRLRQRLARIGSTESALIWRTKTTPHGRLISRLAPSTLHTNGNGCTGSRWTTTTRDWKDSAGMAPVGADGRPRLDQLPRQMVSYSPAPRSSNPNATFTGTDRAERDLPTQMHVHYQTAYAPTPTSLSFKDSHQPGNSRSSNLMRAHFAMDQTGPTTNGSSAPSTEKRGAPNPEFPFWLMGFPDAWISGALAAMQSFRKSQPKSSPRFSTSASDLFTGLEELL